METCHKGLVSKENSKVVNIPLFNGYVYYKSAHFFFIIIF